MGLISKTVIMKWNSKIKKHYESKGYVYTKMGDEFEVKVEDLTEGSNVLIDVKCDCEDCKNPIIKPLKWQSYFNSIHDNKYYCRECATMLFGKEKTNKTKLSNGKSFYDWCIEHNKQDILDRWDYELNDKKPNEILFRSNKKYYFKCPRGLHPSELICIDMISGKYNKNLICSSCNSFGQWCLDNLPKEKANEILSRWDYELNKCSPFDVSYGISKKKYYFKCPKRLHDSELKNIGSITGMGIGNSDCKQCNSFAQYLIDEYGKNALNDYWDYEKNININPWKMDKNSNNKAWIKCKDVNYHESNYMTLNDFVNGNRCPYCGHQKIHPLDSLGQYIIDNYGEDFLNKIWSEKNKKSAFEYFNMNNNKVWWKCPDGKHEDYERTIYTSTRCEFRCPECIRERDESILQNKTRLYLESLRYDILHEYDTLKCINPKTKHQLPYDNEIILLNGIHLIIEVNGRQHYELCGFHYTQAKYNNTTPKQEFHYQRLKDKYKRMYAKHIGYEYLEIPYWTDDKDESWKKIINDKIDKCR